MHRVLAVLQALACRSVSALEVLRNRDLQIDIYSLYLDVTWLDDWPASDAQVLSRDLFTFCNVLAGCHRVHCWAFSLILLVLVSALL